MASACQNLEWVLQRLEEKQQGGWRKQFEIPGIWHVDKAMAGTVQVDPFAYLSNYIREQLLPRKRPQIENYLLPISLYKDDQGWLTGSGIYCLDVRTASSWDYDGDGKMVEDHGDWTEMGTFLKTLLLLPHIQRLGLDVLYLLPVLKPSRAYSKGELGSFYAIKNFYELNPALHDPMLDLPQASFSIETEFRAVVEACHLLGIRVIFDFPLRTASRDNDLMVEHPDWFYWIHCKDLDKYQVPYYHCLDEHVPPSPENLHTIYPLPETKDYLKVFSFSPNRVDPEAWDAVKAEYAANPGQNILELVEREFGLTTAPAYSDWINDPQPSWDDITFLKLYLDFPAVRDGFFDGTEPPFLFFDAIKTNLYPGKLQNSELWDYLAGIIRFYQENFGIDGARIDMAHALPEELERLIISRTLAFDPDFSFISEDLQNSNHQIARYKGYHSIIGETWSVEGKLNGKSLLKLLQELPTLSLPSFAAAETPDTPRAVVRNGGPVFSRLVAIMNFFLPNSVAFINNGFELYERQPMNLGLDNTEAGRFVLSKDELYYGRLSFFDRYQFHWLNEGAREMVEMVNQARQLQQRFRALMQKKEHFYVVPAVVDEVVQFGYRSSEGELICLVNLDFSSVRSVTVAGELVISSAVDVALDLLQPGEFRVYWIDRSGDKKSYRC